MNMRVAKGVGGALLILIGLIWIGQGLNIIKGSGMTGHPIYALLGIVVAVLGLWLLWSLQRAGRIAGGQPRS